VSIPFPGTSASRADWTAHRDVVRVWRVVITFAAAWVTAINLAFFTAVLREFAPEFLSTITRVISGGG
jgi:hypothetical protein